MKTLAAHSLREAASDDLARASQPVDETPAEDAADSLVDLDGPPEARAAVLGLVAEIDRLRSEADGLRARLRELEALADNDPLVPALNRRAFMRELERMMSYAARYALQPSLVFVDLNDFKRINDAHGHNVGDAVLVHVAELLGRHVRASDVVGRIGGDEFAIALASGGVRAAEIKAEALARALRCEPARFEGFSYAVSASFGVYALGGDESAEQALAHADAAMYQRKRAERGA